MRQCTKSSGFTLVELMIVLAILMIIMFWAVPNYTRQINEVRRSDAYAALIGEVQRLEHCFGDRDTYLGCEPTDYTAPVLSAKGHYLISGVVTASDYTLVANVNPAGDQVNDQRCASLTINKLGVRTASSVPVVDTDGDGTPDAGADTTTECWKER